MADNNDKDMRELLKLKQGLIDEKDSSIRLPVGVNSVSTS